MASAVVTVEPIARGCACLLIYHPGRCSITSEHIKVKVKVKVNTTAARGKAGPQEPPTAHYRLRMLGHSFPLRHGFGWPGAKSRKEQRGKNKRGETGDERRLSRSPQAHTREMEVRETLPALRRTQERWK